MQDDLLHRSLDKQVKTGRLTQDQADEFEGWYQSRPEALSPQLRFRAFGGHGFFGGQKWGGHGKLGGGFYHGVVPTPTPEISGGDPT